MIIWYKTFTFEIATKIKINKSFLFRFFGLVGGTANKKDCKERTRTGCSSLQGTSSSSALQANQSSMCGSSKRRGSDRSLTSSPHELPINSVKVSQSHSQSNLSDIPYR